MSKQILPNELAEIVTGLLVKPDVLGELETPAKHQSFMYDIGRVVAEYCGGNINWANESETGDNYLKDEYNSPYLSVSPNENLPGLNNNVWSYFDPDGWEDNQMNSDVTKPLTVQSIADTRKILQGLLCNMGLSNGSSQKLCYEMVDWRIADNVPLEKEGDDRLYSVVADIGNQSCLELMDKGGDPFFGLLVEINHGVPAIHIDLNGGDSILHIHVAQGGLVLTPDDRGAGFDKADMDCYSYNDKSSLVIR